MSEVSDELIERTEGQVPWHRNDWTGQFLSFDGTATTDFGADDVFLIHSAGNSGEGWDGNAAAVILLKDGRWVAYESFWGPTGDGFNSDAYGGDSNIYFASTVENAIKFGLTNTGRELLKLSISQELPKCEQPR